MCVEYDSIFFFFFFKQKTAYEMLRSLVGSEMCIRDRIKAAADKANQELRHEERSKASQHVREVVDWIKQRDPRVPQEAKGLGPVTERERTAEQSEADTFYALSEWIAGLGIKTKDAQLYTGALCDEGHDSFKAISKLDEVELVKGLRIKKAHAKRILSEAQAIVGAGSGEDEGSVAEAEVEMLDDAEFFGAKADKKDKKERKNKKLKLVKSKKGYQGVKMSYG
eukprot:TRINITY_DN11745_c0_g4_i1.p1 TRINITY_DN11745_c0_g4~~TRINITY_DN11745_c0_g4_i1.p1  ORF type:complete len:224 (+),score=92.92 TRINITY_DN11745_c0_g4_i1:22-693(+)